ncbi:MAG: UMP kinase [Eubacterium sp.]|nr:UMP kinase [Eubacterium sp.]
MGKYKRVLLKLSGEALAGDRGTGLDEATAYPVAGQIKELVNDGVQVAVVIGGGNFWRGRSSDAIDRTKADQIGMLATVMNCIYMSEICRATGLKTAVLTPFECGSFTKLFSKDRVNKYLGKGMVVFLAGGTGHPYFSTDTATALRAIEIEADIILAAKSVDGVYDSDPGSNPDAKRYDRMEMKEIVDKQLGVVDLAAAVLCMENHMPMYVFGLNEENSILKTVAGETTGTLISAD